MWFLTSYSLSDMQTISQLFFMTNNKTKGNRINKLNYIGISHWKAVGDNFCEW